jgi:hypothetical protein
MLVPTPERAIRTVYWDLFDKTEVWTRIVPRAAGGRAKLPISLVFSATFRRRVRSSADIVTPPGEIMVLAQPDPLAVLPIPNLSFAVATDRGAYDFIEAGVAHRAVASCDSCSVDAIVARIDAELFRTIVDSRTVAAHVLGFRCTLDPADIDALRRFARHVKLSPYAR